MNLLVSASEADPARGFMARLLVLCSLPRSNPGNRHQYKRTNGPFTLYMNAVGGCKLPYGNLPRLILAWVCSEAVRTQSRVLVLGKPLSGFMRALGGYSSSGEKHTRLRNQMKRLFGCTVSMIYEDEGGEARVSSLVAAVRVIITGGVCFLHAHKNSLIMCFIAASMRSPKSAPPASDCSSVHRVSPISRRSSPYRALLEPTSCLPQLDDLPHLFHRRRAPEFPEEGARNLQIGDRYITAGIYE